MLSRLLCYTLIANCIIAKRESSVVNDSAHSLPTFLTSNKIGVHDENGNGYVNVVRRLLRHPSLRIPKRQRRKQEKFLIVRSQFV